MDIWNSYLSANCFLFFYFINVGDSPLKFFVCFNVINLLKKMIGFPGEEEEDSTSLRDKTIPKMKSIF